MIQKLILNVVVLSFLFGCGSSFEFTELPIGGNIEAIDKAGNPVSFKSMQEPVLLVFFGYTYCPDFCPNTLAKIKTAIEPLTNEEKTKFKVVFISVDPVRDSPETTTKYVRFYLEQSIGLSFSQSTTNQILKQYAAYVEKTEDGQSFDHSTYIYVLDRNRKTRKLIKSTDSKEVITKSIQLLSGNSVESK
ncbi:SCO family protein [Leptospira kanakyensis]|uniref:SCO family protein n=1 Tax=Leptospira kanakyensis TaxID=2484968 RepID=A0A6N4PZE2_9LEPT|nr:SCO family protein [Leptospira kanakyensis]MCW7481113.1 SCO family protein [Leptospira kanakyensis]TGK47889.1 SCO family protein [Leptospira kanakyensis]TGK63103.1 SCO family protein [Leptospira kanakyensis]TGK66709.1 SCO family protein [Leptospira kanakyensis]